MMKNNLKSYKELNVWQKSMDLTVQIYQITKEFPKEETYGLTSQMRRSAMSIPCNIAEGYQRSHIKEYIQFLHISKGSAAELETQLDLVSRLNVTDGKQLESVQSLLTEILKMLSAQIKNLHPNSYPLNPISLNPTPYPLNPNNGG